MTFGITLMVLLFVMAIANIFKVIDLFSRGVSGILILKVFSYGIPSSLIFAIPMSVLAAVFLQFNRLASDREIIAMKACGISLWSIVRPPFLIALALCGLCIYINCNVAPDSHYAYRKIRGKLGIETPISLLDEGRFIRDFPGLTIYIGKKTGSAFKDIIINQVEKDGLKRTIRAASGAVTPCAGDPGKIQINLFRVRIEQPDEKRPDNLSLTRYLNAEEYPLTIDVQGLVNRDVVWKKRADLTMGEIISALRFSTSFAPKDFVAPDRILARFKAPADAIGAYVQSLFTDEALQTLGSYTGAEAQKKNVARLMAAEFNRIIAGEYIYSPEHFTNVSLTDRTLDYMRTFKPGESATRVNRMLLEDAFPEEIVKSAFLDLYRTDIPMYHTALLVEANTRMALSFCCFAFVLLGAALGIRIHRKESSIGVAVSLLLVFIFYFFIIIADSLVNRPDLHPHLIVWIPFVLSLLLGCYLIQRSD